MTSYIWHEGARELAECRGRSRKAISNAIVVYPDCRIARLAVRPRHDSAVTQTSATTSRKLPMFNLLRYSHPQHILRKALRGRRPFRDIGPL